MFTVAARNVTTAPMVTARGRSPGARGFSAARASALRTSERGGGLGAAAAGAGARRGARCFLLRLPNYPLRGVDEAPQLCGGSARIGGVADRSHDTHPLAPRVPPRAAVRRVDPADREPGLVRLARRGVLHELEPDRGPARLGWRLVDGPDGEVVRARADRVVHLLARVGRHADEHVVAHRLERRVVLAEM